MFYDTKIEIIPSPAEAPIQIIYADLQPYSGKIDFDYGLSLEISQRVFCDIDQNINENTYFKIDSIFYKVLKIKEWSDYLEIYLYKCQRQVS